MLESEWANCQVLPLLAARFEVFCYLILILLAVIDCVGEVQGTFSRRISGPASPSPDLRSDSRIQRPLQPDSSLPSRRPFALRKEINWQRVPVEDFSATSQLRASDRLKQKPAEYTDLLPFFIQ